MTDFDYTILQCPLTGENLIHILKEEVAASITKSDFEYIQSDEIKEGFINESRTYFYPVYDEIILLLPVYALYIGTGTDQRSSMSRDRERVFDYYNELKYSKAGENLIYEDTPKWVDFRDVSDEYIHHSLTRAKPYLSAGGRYLLDIASGPIGLDEYVDLSENFDIRICADISVNALRQARWNYRHRKGLFICADICNIPVKENVCDSVLCQHTLYHIPKDEQKRAVEEMYRVTKPGSNMVIVYSWFYRSWFMNISLLPVQLYRVTRHFAGKAYVRLFKGRPRLYFFPHSMRWFRKSFAFSDKIEFYSWRSANKYFLRIYIHKMLGGRRILRWLSDSETRHARFWARMGEYPIIKVIK